MSCQYCYSSENGNSILTPETFDTIVHKFGSYYNFIHFSWHGGEPLLMGKNYFQLIYEIQNSFFQENKNKVYSNSIQTNGWLLNPTWYNFLKSLNFSITVSYDGLNSVRMLKNNQPIHLGLVNRLKELHEKTGYSPPITCVLSKRNINFPKEMYNHFKELKISSFAILPYFGKDKSFQISSNGYYLFHKNLFDVWRNDKSKVIKNILPFSQILNSIFHNFNENICSWDGKCFENSLAIEPNGDIYLCNGLFDSTHKIGNIITDNLIDIYQAKNYKNAITAQNDVINSCKNCDVFKICGSGCRIGSFFLHGHLNKKDALCEGRKRIIKYVLESVN